MTVEKKQKCIFCKRYIFPDITQKKMFRNFKKQDTVHIKGDLFGKNIDEIVHKECYKNIFGV